MVRRQILVKPNARNASVSVDPKGQLVVAVRAPAQEGKANQELIAVLADYFHPAFSWSRGTLVAIK
ncbi:DUF167 domain-containing protein [uncultured Thermosynechococcus sp.]|uniref:DUF167 domain-containing protein n=1 Tax=uncultured Thermosynechococcus sp. TaxID=436945 RepID=UPI00261D28A6|nr:DUF167 domain-containing protein [uncultured Thermosynechococcus sp.]